MFRRYHHGHSVGVGVLLGLALTRHGLVLAGGSLALGLILGRGWATLATTATVIRMAANTAAKRSGRLVPVYRVPRAKPSAQTDDIPF